MKQMLFVDKILNWFDANKRILPWRETNDPYKIWLSEVILQQTRVNQGLPYYLEFVKTFPTVRDLASAREQQVLRLWQGLGYYSRARNLHRCAKVINEAGGSFPKTFDELKKLPGVGPYTAAAIASIAFHEPVAVVDGNVYRVLARIFGIDKDIASAEGKEFFFKKANELVPRQNPGDYNQAVMEFGATHCTPKNPKCSECPFSTGCIARAQKTIAQLPVKSKKVKVRVRYLNYFIFMKNDKIAMKRREDKDIWSGLYDFFLVETMRTATTQKIIEESRLLKTLRYTSVTKVGKIKHILSHQQLRITFNLVQINGKPTGLTGGLKFYSRKQITKLPKPIVITRFVENMKLP